MPRKPSSPAAEKPIAEPAAADGIAGMNFEQAIGELENIVDQMENGEVSLNESLAAYQRGAALVSHCRSSLKAVAQQVKVLEGGLLKPLSADGEIGENYDIDDPSDLHDADEEDS